MHNLTRLLAMVSIAASTAVAQGTGVVRGRVTDSSSRAPRSGISLAIVGTPLATSSGADGGFALTRVPAGTRRLHVRGIGITELTLPVLVVAGDTTEIEVIVRATVVSLKAM